MVVKITAPIIWGTQKGTLILTTTHIVTFFLGLNKYPRGPKPCALPGLRQFLAAQAVGSLRWKETEKGLLGGLGSDLRWFIRFRNSGEVSRTRTRSL